MLTPDLCQYVYFYYVNTYARLMPVSIPETCQYLRLIYANMYTWNMPILMPDLWQYLCLTYVNTYAWRMRIHMPDLCQYLCPGYANNYARFMPDLCQYVCLTYANTDVGLTPDVPQSKHVSTIGGWPHRTTSRAPRALWRQVTWFQGSRASSAVTRKRLEECTATATSILRTCRSSRASITLVGWR